MSLIAYYECDDGAGTACADSHSGNLDLTSANTVAAADGGWDFERTDQYFFGLADAAFSLTGDFTISVWVKSEARAGAAATYGQGVAQYKTANQAGDWSIGVGSSGQVICSHWSEAGNDANGLLTTNSSNLITDGNWHHIVFRLSGSTYTIWVDGVSQAFSTGAVGPGWDDTDFRVGTLYITGGGNDGYFFDGVIKKLGLDDSALSDGDIATLYNAGAGGEYGDWPSGADVTPPTVSSPTVGAGGTTTTLTLSESGCVFDGGGTSVATAAGFAFSNGATVTAAAISGTTLTLTHSLIRVFESGITITYDRTATTDDIRDAASNYLASFTGGSAQAVTNNSKNLTLNAAETVTLTASLTGITNTSIPANATLDGSASFYNFIQTSGAVSILGVLKRLGTTRTTSGASGGCARTLTDDDANYAFKITSSTTGIVLTPARVENCSDGLLTVGGTATATVGGDWGVDVNGDLSSRVVVRTCASTSQPFLTVTGTTSGLVAITALLSRHSYLKTTGLTFRFGSKTGSATNYADSVIILGQRAGLDIRNATFSIYGALTYCTHEWTAEGAAGINFLDDDGGGGTGNQVNNFYRENALCTEAWDSVFYKGQWVTNLGSGTIGAAGHLVVIAGIDSHRAIASPADDSTFAYCIICGPEVGQGDYLGHVGLATNTTVTFDHCTLVGFQDLDQCAIGADTGCELTVTNSAIVHFDTPDASAFILADGAAPRITDAHHNGFWNPLSAADHYDSQGKIGGGALGTGDVTTDPLLPAAIDADGTPALPYTVEELADGTYDVEDVIAWYTTTHTPEAGSPWEDADSTGTGDIGAVAVSTDPIPDLSVTVQGGAAVADGATDALGTKERLSTVTRSYTITNDGDATATLGTITVEAGLTITADPSGLTIAPEATRTLTVSLDTSTSGAKDLDISIPSDDSSTPYNWNVTATVEDTTVPVLVSAVYNRTLNIITLTYDEDLDPVSEPGTGDFAVDGVNVVAISMDSATKVFVEVDADPEPGSTLDYTAGVNPIQDVAGNDAANLTNQFIAGLRRGAAGSAVVCFGSGFRF